MDQLAVCLLIFAVTVIGYCSGLYSIATISQISLIALTLTGCLSAKQALGYYSNSNVIMIAGMWRRSRPDSTGPRFARGAG